MARWKACACTTCPAHEGSCGELTQARHCPPCATQAELKRGRRQARGYDAEHDRLREWWRPKVERCTVHCHADTCIEPSGRLILPHQEWDLGHDDQRQHRGPEHSSCNRSAGGKAAHQT